MKFPIAIEPGNDTQAWGVVVPDLPGCFSASDQGIDDAIDNTKEAIEAWIETALDKGMAIPAPSPIGALQADRQYAGWVWAIVEIDSARLQATSSAP